MKKFIVLRVLFAIYFYGDLLCCVQDVYVHLGSVDGELFIDDLILPERF